MSDHIAQFKVGRLPSGHYEDSYVRPIDVMFVELEDVLAGPVAECFLIGASSVFLEFTLEVVGLWAWGEPVVKDFKAEFPDLFCYERDFLVLEGSDDIDYFFLGVFLHVFLYGTSQLVGVPYLSSGLGGRPCGCLRQPVSLPCVAIPR